MASPAGVDGEKDFVLPVLEVKGMQSDGPIEVVGLRLWVVLEEPDQVSERGESPCPRNVPQPKSIEPLRRTVYGLAASRTHRIVRRRGTL